MENAPQSSRDNDEAVLDAVLAKIEKALPVIYKRKAAEVKSGSMARLCGSTPPPPTSSPLTEDVIKRQRETKQVFANMHNDPLLTSDERDIRIGSSDEAAVISHSMKQSKRAAKSRHP